MKPQLSRMGTTVVKEREDPDKGGGIFFKAVSLPYLPFYMFPSRDWVFVHAF